MKNDYRIIKNAVDKNVCEFLCNYLFHKREIFYLLREHKYISLFDQFHGVSDDTQKQNDDTYSIYGDATLDTLMCLTLPKVEEAEGSKLIPTYSFARVYTMGEILYKHVDRSSCKVSATVHLGGDKWDIFLRNKNKKIKVDLDQGDMLVFYGDISPHWRDQFSGEACYQVFLHYNKEEDKEKNKFDGRLYLGVPKHVKP